DGAVRKLVGEVLARGPDGVVAVQVLAEVDLGGRRLDDPLLDVGGARPERLGDRGTRVVAGHTELARHQVDHAPGHVLAVAVHLLRQEGLRLGLLEGVDGGEQDERHPEAREHLHAREAPRARPAAGGAQHGMVLQRIYAASVVLWNRESVHETVTVTVRRPKIGSLLPETCHFRVKFPPAVPSARSGFAGSVLMMPGATSAAPSGVLRSCSSFCCARAWAALVESALF